MQLDSGKFRDGEPPKKDAVECQLTEGRDSCVLCLLMCPKHRPVTGM